MRSVARALVLSARDFMRSFMLLAMVMWVAIPTDRDECGLGVDDQVLLVFFAYFDVLVVGSFAVRKPTADTSELQSTLFPYTCSSI